ncbi:MAG: MBG domain-containing protein, partial [Verrucomicrobiota bacterium]
MKPKSVIDPLITTVAQPKRLANVPRWATPISAPMKTLKIKILLVLLALVSPWLLQAQTTESFTYTTNRLVPDGNAAGLSDVRNVSSAIGTITSVKVRLKLTGEFNGDLYGYLVHSNGFTVLINRPGKTALDFYGYGDSGLDVTFQTGAANGDLHLYQNVVTPSAGSPLTGIWEPDGRNVDPATVTDASARTTSLTNFNGLDANGNWTLYLVDVDSGATNMLTEWGLDITGSARPTLLWTTPTDIVYGTPLSGTQLNATVTYNSTNVPGTFSYSPAAGIVLNAGLAQTLSVTFTPTDTNSFLPISQNVTINVQKAPLSIAAVDQSKIYGAALPSLTANYTGFVNGDDFSSLDTAVTLATTATASSPVGVYPITASGAVDANYTITHVAGALTVTTAPLTIAAVDKNKIYGAALPALTANYTGFVNGDTASSLGTAVTLTTTATASSPIGVYPITASGAVGTNYSITQVAGTLTVTTAPLTIAAVDKSKIYGAALPTLTANYTGFVNGDTTSSLGTDVTLATTATASSPIGTYPITASGAVGTNYSITQVAGTL